MEGGGSKGRMGGGWGSERKNRDTGLRKRSKHKGAGAGGSNRTWKRNTQRRPGTRRSTESTPLRWATETHPKSLNMAPRLKHKTKGKLEVGYINAGRSEPVTQAALARWQHFDIFWVGEPRIQPLRSRSRASARRTTQHSARWLQSTATAN